jgi:hypothetical protein
MGEDAHIRLLEQTLEEEKQTDEKLTRLAGNINSQAAETGNEVDKSEASQSKSNSGKGSRRAA